MPKCTHDKIKVLAIYPADDDLETQCEGCGQKVKVKLTTLPSAVRDERPKEFASPLEVLRWLLEPPPAPDKEWQDKILEEAKAATTLALRDKDQADEQRP